jgi:predicted ATP-binding protein involved in virulence
LELSQLSDGYRNLLALVLDFARRLAQAHPNWPNPLEAPGILLIDEVELHLHPKWQQTIITDLHAVFPNTQIIVTTHSPYVVTTVESRCVHIAENAVIRPCPAPTYGARVSDVVAEVMGVPNQRPPNNPTAQKIANLFKAIDEGDLGSARLVRAELANWANGFPEPDLVRADLMMRRLEVRANAKDAAQS